MSKCIIVVGNTGTGKTTFVKQFLRGNSQKKFIYDINNEYRGEFIFRTKDNIKDFIKEVKVQENSTILFEEATIFFRHHNTGEEVINLLVRKRHTKNVIVFNFHALHQVPIILFDFCNYLVLKKTNDFEENIRKYIKNPVIFEAYKKVKNSENNFEQEIIKLN